MNNEHAGRCRSSETSNPKATGRSSPERTASNREDAAATVAAGSGEQAELEMVAWLNNLMGEHDFTIPLKAYRAIVRKLAIPQAEPKRDQSMLDLLAVIHCDGGHHTEAVGIEQSIKDAQDAVCTLKIRLAQTERERASEQAMAELAQQSQELGMGYE